MNFLLCLGGLPKSQTRTKLEMVSLLLCSDIVLDVVLPVATCLPREAKEVPVGRGKVFLSKCWCVSSQAHT